MRKITFQFVYSHCGVSRNECADKAADVALDKYYEMSEQLKASVPLMAIKAAVKSGCKLIWLTKCCETTHRYEMVGGAFLIIAKQPVWDVKMKSGFTSCVQESVMIWVSFYVAWI